MTAFPTYRLGGLAALVVLGGLVAFAFGIPALAACTAPLAVFLAWGLLLDRQAPCHVNLAIDRDRAFEGETVALTLSVTKAAAWGRVLCDIHVPEALQPLDPPARFAFEPDRSGRATAVVEVACRTWGAHVVGPVRIRARHRFGVFLATGASGETVGLRVYPAASPLRVGVSAQKTQVYVGNQLSRQRAEGLEFADIRLYAAGDQVRRINWRVTARRHQPYVNVQNPERNADLILLVDSFGGLRTGAEGTMAAAGRAAAALAEMHLLRRRDRVGLIAYGGVLQWLAPGMGRSHLYRVLDALIDTKVVTSYARPDLDVLPPRILPPQALVVAVSPLTDPRMVRALLDIRGRGFDLAVVEVDPERYVETGTGSGAEVALRVWRLWREARRRDLLRASIPLVRWEPGTSLDGAVTTLNQLRRGRWAA